MDLKVARSLKSIGQKTFSVTLSGMKCLAVIFFWMIILIGHAQETCETLVASIEQTFDKASQVIMTTNIMQGQREFAYSKLKLYKDRAGEWQSDILEQRGVQRPQNSQGTEDGAEPSFEFSCDEHEIIEETSGWTLSLQEQNPDIPVEAWVVTYGYENNALVPLSISGDFEAKILLIPFRGSFNTSFSDWTIPVP